MEPFWCPLTLLLPVREAVVLTSSPHVPLKVSRTIPVIEHVGLWGSELLGIPHCLDNQLTDGGKVVSLTHRPRFTPQKLNFSTSDTHFFQPSTAGRIS
jgi:hypothetical protein